MSKGVKRKSPEEGLPDSGEVGEADEARKYNILSDAYHYLTKVVQNLPESVKHMIPGKPSTPITKKCILYISLHGAIPLQQNKDGIPEPILFTSPIPITRILAASPGVCNIASPKSMSCLAKEIKETLDPTEIQQALKNTYPLIEGYLEQNKHQPLVKRFKHNTHRQNLTTFAGGAQIIDKIYSQTDGSGDVCRRTTFDMQALLIGNFGYLSIIDDIFRDYVGGNERGTITLSQMVDYCYRKRGIDELIIVDNSCSVFKGVYRGITITERDEHVIMRNVFSGKYGGRNRKSRKTRKSRKSRKSRKTRKNFFNKMK